MGDEIVVNGLKQNDVEDQKKVWMTGLTEVRQKIASLNEELAQLQRQALALEGAVQACDVFSQKIQSSSPTN